MEIVNKIEAKFDKFKKCHLVLDADCPVGELYDYSCAVIAFCIQKMQEVQPKPQEPKSQEEVKTEELQG